MEGTRYVKEQENGNILLIPCGLVNQTTPGGITITPVTLSRMGFTIRWFSDFLAGTKNLDEYAITGKTYQAFRDSGKVYLKETRDGGNVSIIGFSSEEIQEVLEELKSCNTQESGNASEI
jgi:hypothetical protein